MYLGSPEDLRNGVGDIFARKVMQIPNLETVFESELILKFLKITIFQHQLIWPKLLYLGSPEDLRGVVGDIFARKVMQIPNLETVFESELILKFLKITIFQHQLIWPKLLYLGNPEDLRGGVGDIFARKVMQITNLETVFESEQIWNF